MALLKFQDIDVMEFNFSDNTYQIKNEKFLPVLLRGRIIENQTVERLPAKEQINALVSNKDAMMDFFSSRSIDISRTNAKQILNTLGLPQELDRTNCMKIMFACKGLSAADDYWFAESSSEKWKDVNLRDNPLHETLAHIALFGDTTVSITGKVRTPELTNQGAYPKAWERKNGKLYLHKGSRNDHAAEQEVSTSHLLDCTNVPHVQYWMETIEGKMVCTCECMCNDKVSIIPAHDFIRWNEHMKKNTLQRINQIDQENFNKMLIVDYLIANPDRHGKNWGFYMDAKSGDIISLHPLFDHNLSFDRATVAHPYGGMSLLFPEKTKFDVAKEALRHCDFQIVGKISEKVFLEKYQAALFTDRCNRLGLHPVTTNSFFAGYIEKAKKTHKKSGCGR